MTPDIKQIKARLGLRAPTVPIVYRRPTEPPKAPTPAPDPHQAAIENARRLLFGASDHLSKRRCMLVLPVLEKHNVTWAEIIAPCRRQHIVDCRHEIMAELRDDGMTLSQIGAALGGMDHTTVMHGIRKVFRTQMHEGDHGA